jgi:hypothetical protein
MDGRNRHQVEGESYRFASTVREQIEPWLHRIQWPVLLLILLPLVMLGRALLPGRVFSAADNLFFFYPWHALEPGAVPQNSLLGDRTFVFEPSLIYASRQIHNGRFPLWNPHAYAGAPLLGNFQSALLFPLTALAYALPVQTALGLIAILKIATAGLSMYWMLGVLGLEPLAATAGALAFMFSGCMIVWLGWPVTNVAIWLPLLVGLTDRLRETGAWRYAGWLALVVGVQFLGGHPETSFFIIVLTACYALWRARARGGGRFAVQFVAAGIIGGLIAAVQLFPFFHYLALSSVFYYRRQSHIIRAIPVRAAIALLLPNYFGTPASANFWGPGNYNEISASVGVLPWILVPCALFGGWKRREGKFFLGAAILIGLVVYDIQPFPWLLSKIPGFSVAVNRRLIALLSFSLAVLCAIGMHTLINPPPAARVRIIINSVKLLSFLLLAIIAANLIADVNAILQRHLATYVAVQCGAIMLLLAAGTFATIYALQRGACSTTLGMFLLAIELLSVLPFAPFYNPIIETSEFYPITPALKYLQRDRSLFRVLLPIPDVGAVYGQSDIVGYDGMTPRQVEQLADPSGSVARTGSAPLRFTEDLTSWLSDLVNLKYVLLAPGTPSPGLKFQLVYDGPDGRIYQNRNVFPRAFLVPHARTCLDDSSALALIRSGQVDLGREVVIAGCPHLLSGSSFSGNVKVEDYQPQRVIVSADVRSPAILVLTDTYDSDWRAWVDGHKVPLLRADFAFRAVALGPGSHKVKFLYRPVSVVVGLVLSIIALVGTVALIWLGGGNSA